MLRNRNEKRTNSLTKEFKVGDLLRVSSNEKLIQDKQQYCGGYSKMRMHDLIGKLVLVKHFSNKCVKVEKDGRDYDLHPDILDYPKSDYKYVLDRDTPQKNKPEDTPDKRTQLFAIIALGEAEKLYQIIDPDILNIRNAVGQTPINNACITGQQELVNILLEFGADINIPDNNGNFPVHNCIFKGFDDILKIILDKYPESKNTKTVNGLSLLAIAKQKENKSLEEYLSSLYSNRTSFDNSLDISLPYPPKTITPPLSDRNNLASLINYSCDTISLMNIPTDSEEDSERVDNTTTIKEYDTITMPSNPKFRQSMSPSLEQTYDKCGPVENECSICRDSKLNIAFVKCGHLACKRCADRIVICHICKADIEDRMPIFL